MLFISEFFFHRCSVLLLVVEFFIFFFFFETYAAKGVFGIALEKLTYAAGLAPNNPMTRFHRGKVLMALGQHEVRK